MTKQPEALRLADWLEEGNDGTPALTQLEGQAAAELRRLHEVNVELLGLVKRYRTETPLGHQPHMISLAADEVIAKATGETE